MELELIFSFPWKVLCSVCGACTRAFLVPGGGKGCWSGMLHCAIKNLTVLLFL